jgi:hypothetical protein
MRKTGGSIPAPVQTFKATIKGEFPRTPIPADEVLECKKDAQVMFVKNDISREKRYYNGKIGKIDGHFARHDLRKMPRRYEDIDVMPAEWSNVKYTLNEQTKEVKEEILGTFKQYPLKLAWAITIHKSQGLTFERAIIDAQAAFAHGQVYVALSRCKSFEGIVLRSKIAFFQRADRYGGQKLHEEADKNAPTSPPGALQSRLSAITPAGTVRFAANSAVFHTGYAAGRQPDLQTACKKRVFISRKNWANSCCPPPAISRL